MSLLASYASGVQSSLPAFITLNRNNNQICNTLYDTLSLQSFYVCHYGMTHLSVWISLISEDSHQWLQLLIFHHVICLCVIFILLHPPLHSALVNCFPSINILHLKQTTSLFHQEVNDWMLFIQDIIKKIFLEY